MIIILVLGALTTISPLTIDMYLSSFNQLAVEFNSTVPKVSLSLSSYFIGLALGQIFYGPLLDRFGRKPPIYFGLTIYVLASVACYFAPTLEVFIALRFIQALGGCSASVASTTMVSDFFPEKERAKIFSICMLILSVSPLFAPTLGGIISSYLGWRSIFLILAVIVTSIVIGVHFLLPDPHQGDKEVSLNFKAIFSTYREVFRVPQFFAYALSGAFSFSGLFVFLAGTPAIFMKTLGVSEKEFGVIFALLTIGMVGGGQFNIFLQKYFNQQKIYLNAIRCQVVVGIFFFIGSLMGWFGLGWHFGILFIYLSCIGLTYPNAASLALVPFTKNRGSASAMLGFVQMGLGAVASGIFGLLNFGPSVSVSGLFVAFGIVAFLLSRKYR